MSIQLAGTVRDAIAGDQNAWDELVSRFSAQVWAIARAYRLSSHDAADVSQTVWLRLAEHIGRLRDPERIEGWLAVTARNEALRVIRRRERQVPMGEDHFFSSADVSNVSVDSRLIAAEESSALWQAFGRLGEACRVLLRMMITDPPPSYVTISETLGMPVGSIGPRRARCLENLRAKINELSPASPPAPSLVKAGDHDERR